MSLRKYFSTALTLLVAASIQGASAEDYSDAKGMFFEQLEKAEKNINTGLQYWIELNRNGKVIRVSNKHQFMTNDKIRFHVTPNIDGFAYILLKSGSRGERAVLFPDAKQNEENRVKRGKEMVIPNDGYLTFDENPGTENLVLLLSRQPLDATAYLEETQETVMLAANMDGSKDLIPTKIYVSYGVPHVNPIKKPAESTGSSSTAAASQTSESTNTTTSQQVSVTHGAKKAKTEKPAARKPAAPARKPSPTRVAKTKPVKTGAAGSSAAAVPETKHAVPEHIIASGDTDKPAFTGLRGSAVTTVVKQDPAGLLHLDVILEHK